MSSQGELREMHAYAVGLKCRERILHVMYIARCVHVFPRAILSAQNLEEILSLAILISLYTQPCCHRRLIAFDSRWLACKSSSTLTLELQLASPLSLSAPNAGANFFLQSLFWTNESSRKLRSLKKARVRTRTSG